ncbi:HEAT repeat domain-containing protein [Geomonas oryzae]|uniref:HEAT repeat domain-containing protein n=1 Tax=Geomonas oryzae TaxID=2364273 RepID=UPI0013A5C545|nr:HEAT repeat domain-containing protein [Geomonas oryzae]
MENPFNPFSPLNDDLRGVAADRSVLVDRIVQRLCNTQAGFAVAAGAIGVGKSTLLRGALVTRLQNEGWHPVVVVASADLTTEELLLEVATDLGLGVSSVLERLGLQQRTIEQSTGYIKNSSTVAIVQAHVGHRGEDRKEWSSFQAATALHELARLANTRLALLIDQTEHLFFGSETGSAILLLETLVRAAATPARNGVCAAVAIRQEFLHHLIVLAGPFPSVTSGIVAISGLEPADASKFVDVALKGFGAAFSNKLLATVIRRLSGISGTVWPVALHACCRPLAELSKARGKAVSVRDLEALGDLSGIVGNVVASAIRNADPPFADDAVFGLYVLSDLCQRDGEVRFEKLAQSLPAFPLEDVIRITRLLKALRLIEEPRAGQIRLAHDSLAAAVFGLRHTVQDEEEVRFLDRAVTRWGASDEYLPAAVAANYQANLKQSVPTPHLLLVTQSLFRDRIHLDQNWKSAAVAALTQTDSRQIIRLVVEHATRHGRAPSLRPEEVFVLAATGDPRALATAMTGLVAAAGGPGANWKEADYGDAILISAPVGLNAWLSEMETWRFPAGAFRCIIRALLQQPTIPIDSAVLGKLWERSPRTIKPELLSLVARRFPKHGERLTIECVQNEEGYLRAAAADVAAVLKGNVCVEVIHTCLQDKEAAVRRRGVFAVGEIGKISFDNTLFHLIRSDDSPLVREACLEVLAHLTTSEKCVAEVMKSLDDPVDFVRESAIYALAHLLPEAEAATVVVDAIRDPSPKVREAAMRLMAAAKSLPEHATAISDLRCGPPSLRVAAAEALLYALNDDVNAALDEVLCSPEVDRDTLLASLRTAGARRAEMCLPSIAALLRSNDVAIVCEAIIALTAIGGREVISHFEACAFHVSVDVRERVVYALAELGGKEGVAILITCLSDPRDEIRVRAIYALGRLGAAEAAPRVHMVSQSTSQAREAVEYFFAQLRARSPRSAQGDQC